MRTAAVVAGLACLGAACGCQNTGNEHLDSTLITTLHRQIAALRHEVTVQAHATKARPGQCHEWERRVGRDGQLTQTETVAPTAAIDLGSIGQKMIDFGCPDVTYLRSEYGIGVRPTRQLAPAAPSVPTPRAHQCTLTDEGTCIQGGEFCRDDDEGSYGYDANGRRYLCTDGHWEGPE